MIDLPPQSPPVSRNPAAASPSEPGGAAVSSSDGVSASESPCASLVGPAQSLCYAALYGVSV
jgi:hypothetical protein